MTSTTRDTIIEARNAVKHFVIKTGLMNSRTAGVVRAVDDVSFTIHENETFALVGESGCGKSTMANLILKLTDPTSGEILFRGPRWRTCLPWTPRTIVVAFKLCYRTHMGH